MTLKWVTGMASVYQLYIQLGPAVYLISIHGHRKDVASVKRQCEKAIDMAARPHPNRGQVASSGVSQGFGVR